MLQLLILTDDFTGALDTGVQFVKFGAKTCVTTDPKISFDETEAKVLVIDTETRHIAPEKAFTSFEKSGSGQPPPESPRFIKKRILRSGETSAPNWMG